MERAGFAAPVACFGVSPASSFGRRLKMRVVTEAIVSASLRKLGARNEQSRTQFLAFLRGSQPRSGLALKVRLAAGGSFLREINSRIIGEGRRKIPQRIDSRHGVLSLTS